MPQRLMTAMVAALEICAVIVAAGAVGAVAMFWRLQQGPIELDRASGFLEGLIEARIADGVDVELGSLALTQIGADYQLRIEDFTARGEAGVAIAAADAIAIRLAVGDLVKGEIAPRSFVANGARFEIIRNDERAFEAPAIAARRRLFPERGFGEFINRQFVRSAFREARIENAVVSFRDERSGRQWISEDASLIIERDEGGIAGALTGEVRTDGEAAGYFLRAQFDERTQRVDVRAKGENFPLADVLETAFGARARVIDGPVSGDFALSLDETGAVLSSRFSGVVDSGVVRVGDQAAPIDAIAWAARFDPETDRFDIEELRYAVGDHAGAATGALSLIRSGEQRPHALSFALQIDAPRIGRSSLFEAPFEADHASLTGSYSFRERAVTIDTLRFEALGVVLSGGVSFQRVAPAPEGTNDFALSARIDVAGELQKAPLLTIWPERLATGVRDFVKDRVLRAIVGDFKLRVDLKPGDVNEAGGLPDEAVDLTFSARGVDAVFTQGMSPVRGAVGRGRLRGNSFIMEIDRARVDEVRIVEGEIDFPVIIPKYQDMFYRFTAEGRSEHMLAILNQPPLRILEKKDLSPDQFAGNARADVTIIRPNKRDAAAEEYRYFGEAAFDDVAVDIFAASPGGDLRGATGALTLKPRGMEVRAEAMLAGSPVDVLWTQSFFSDAPSVLSLEGSVNAATGDMFGYSLRRFIVGDVDFRLRAVGDIGAFESVALDLDLGDAAMTIPAVDWRKPRGAAATAAVEAKFEANAVALPRIALRGEGVRVTGRARLGDKGLRDFAFDEFFLDGVSDLSLSGAREATGAINVVATGPLLNLGPFLATRIGGASGANERFGDGALWSEGVKATARIDELRLRGGVFLRDAALDLRRERDRLQRVDFLAMHASGAPLRVSLAPDLARDEPNAGGVLEARTGDIGELLEGLFGYRSIDGGRGLLALDLDRAERDDVAGRIEADRLRVRDAPLLARLFSAGSFEGVADLLNNDGIAIARASGAFSLSGDGLSLSEFRASGPSIGVTAKGEIGFGGSDGLALRGAVAPFHGVNAMFAGAPIIGDVLTGADGAGMVALSYAVTGPRAAPTVVINPLSALTPGIFRNLFDEIDIAGAARNDDD